MTIATICVSLLCVGVCVAQDSTAPPVFACNLKAISTTQRPRYNDLMKRLRSATLDRRELSDDYAFKLDSKAISLPEVAEWVSMERLCCPFLTLQLSASGDQVDWLLNLTGPKGVKPLLQAEFPVR
jgi:hypothetical protein